MYGKALTPLARLLLRLGFSASAVTILGTAGVVVSALWFLPRGQLLLGTLLVMLFLLGDGLDGNVARLSGRETRFGSFLDSTLDRLADGALFIAIAWWCVASGNGLGAGLAAAALLLGFLVSYARARAEAEGWDASVGLFERTDRLVIALVALLSVGLGAPEWMITVSLAIISAGSAVTVCQRVVAAHRASCQDLGSPKPDSYPPRFS